MTADEHAAHLRLKARVARRYLDCAPKQDGAWIRLEKPDGTAFNVREADWPEIERLARAMT